jgi:hypothetical protein
VTLTLKTITTTSCESKFFDNPAYAMNHIHRHFLAESELWNNVLPEPCDRREFEQRFGLPVSQGHYETYLSATKRAMIEAEAHALRIESRVQFLESTSEPPPQPGPDNWKPAATWVSPSGIKTCSRSGVIRTSLRPDRIEKSGDPEYDTYLMFQRAMRSMRSQFLGRQPKRDRENLFRYEYTSDMDRVRQDTPDYHAWLQMREEPPE